MTRLRSVMSSIRITTHRLPPSSISSALSETVVPTPSRLRIWISWLRSEPPVSSGPMIRPRFSALFQMPISEEVRPITSCSE